MDSFSNQIVSYWNREHFIHWGLQSIQHYEVAACQICEHLPNCIPWQTFLGNVTKVYSEMFSDQINLPYKSVLKNYNVY